MIDRRHQFGFRREGKSRSHCTSSFRKLVLTDRNLNSHHRHRENSSKHQRKTAVMSCNRAKHAHLDSKHPSVSIPPKFKLQRRSRRAQTALTAQPSHLSSVAGGWIGHSSPRRNAPPACTSHRSTSHWVSSPFFPSVHAVRTSTPLY